MIRNFFTRLILAATVILIGVAPRLASCQVPSFQISVPNKAAAPNTKNYFPIQTMRVIVTMKTAPNTASPVTFTITDPWGDAAQATAALSPGVSQPPLIFLPSATPPHSASVVAVTAPPTVTTVSDPSGLNFSFLFTLGSDYNQNACVDAMTANTETWTIAAGGGALIAKASVECLDQNITGNECKGTLRVVPLTEPVATVLGMGATPTTGPRAPVDVMLVLDQSGSMGSDINGQASTGPADPTKMAGLQSAVQNFVGVWSDIRAQEAASVGPGYTPAPDQIGVVCFDSTAQWLNTSKPGLNPIDPANAILTDISTNILKVNAATSTSIGGGLNDAMIATASNGFDFSNGHRKVILLMTDGIQNTDPMVQFSAMPVVLGTPIQTTVAGAPTNFPNQSNVQIDSVTLGVAAGVDPAIPQGVATATGGFYVNTEASPSVLNTYFVEAIQNFVQFNTVQTNTIISGTASEGKAFTATIPVSSTTKSAILRLMWNAGAGILRLTATPPGGEEPMVQQSSTGVISMPYSYATSGTKPGSPWTITVSTVRGSAIPFEMMVLTDDVALKADLSIVPGDYKPGDIIKLRAAPTQFGLPIKGIGTHPGDKLLVQLLKPGVNIGDLLSNSQQTTTPPLSADKPSDAANAALESLLRSNPSAYSQLTDTVTLYDDGTHGDAVAGDGVYSGEYPANATGHYTFLFGIQGQTTEMGQFSRMQVRTVYVRPFPDATATAAAQTSVTGTAGSQQLTVSLTPMMKAGGKLGPGWANYLWFVPTGGTGIKAIDTGNGTYKGIIPFSGATPPKVALHFENVLAIIPDSATVTMLPVPLGPGNVFIASVDGSSGSNGSGGGAGGGTASHSWWIWILLLIIVLLVVVYLIKKKVIPI